ncbi:MAG: hypothetical protein NUW37_18310 [Planctomycetes bacterium]|nr:hypothetical protein [Planctomycetota bacterium]
MEKPCLNRQPRSALSRFSENFSKTAVAGLLAREEIKDLSAKSGLSTTDVTDIVIKAL